MIKWKYKPAGNCPVQAEGWFLGYYFYFRARGEYATIEFSESEDHHDIDEVYKVYILTKTKEYMAGWLPKWKCSLLIYKGCLKFIIRKRIQKL
jgi:hypothetical protein